MLEKIAKSSVAKMSAVALSFSLAMPAYGQDYPVYQGSPSNKLQKQWVAQNPVTKEIPLYGPFSEKSERYTLDAQNTKGTIEITVVKNTYYELQQQYKLVQTQEQILYRPKNKVGGYTLTGLAVVGAGGALVGMFGALIAGANNPYVCYDHDGDGEFTDNCGNLHQDTVNALIGVMIGGFALELGTAYLFHKTKPLDMIATEKHRTIVLGDKQEVRTIDSKLTNQYPASVIILQIKAEQFTVDGQSNIKIITDENGHATVQLEPTNPNFAFSVDELANTEIAKQLNKAGIPKQKYLPLLEQAAVPISYDLIIEAKATDGENATETVHVSGYEIPQKALEGIIMGL